MTTFNETESDFYWILFLFILGPKLTNIVKRRSILYFISVQIEGRMSIALAALASFTMAQIWFVLGDRFGSALLNRRPTWQARLERVDTLLQRYGSSLVVGFRALLGIRTLIPIAIGTSDYPTRRFTLLNGVGALIWALVIALAGNTIAQGLDVLVTDLRQHELAAVIVLALIGLVWGLIHLYRQPKVTLLKRD